VGVTLVHPFDRQALIKGTSPDAAEMELTLRNNFPGMEFEGLEVDLDLPENWKGDPAVTKLTLDKDATLRFRLAKPIDDAPGLRVASAIFKLGEYRGSKRSITDLSVTMAERPRAQGLWLVDVDDGITELTKRGGSTCRRAADFKPGVPCYMYFGVSENLPTAGTVYVSVRYFDEGTDPFEMQYDSMDPVGGLAAAYKRTPQVKRGNTQTWKTYTFALSDARFKDAQNGLADLRIASIGSGLSVAWLTVSKFPARDSE
jgi:hypothetical protein